MPKHTTLTDEERKARGREATRRYRRRHPDRVQAQLAKQRIAALTASELAERRKRKRERQRLYVAQNRAAIYARAREGCLAHADELNARRRARYAADAELREKKRLEQQHWYEANRDRQREYGRLYYLENHADIRAKAKAKYAANPERFLAAQRAAQAADRERFRAYNRKWRLANLDKARMRDNAYNAANREKRAAYTRAYRRANPEYYADQIVKRIARLRGAGAVEDISRREVYERDGGACYLCSTPIPYQGYHLDHIVPVSKGGAHTSHNVATSCAPCNLRKRNKLPPLDRIPSYARAYVDAFVAAPGERSRTPGSPMPRAMSSLQTAPASPQVSPGTIPRRFECNG